MRKKLIRIVAIFAALCSLCGCWDSAELQDHDIVTAVLIDNKDSKDILYIETAKLSSGSNGSDGSGGGGNSQQYQILCAEGKSLVEARDVLDRRSDQPIYLGATRAVLMTDTYCKMGIEEYLNRMRGDIFYRKPVLLVTTASDPQKLLSDRPENSPSVGNEVENTLENLNHNGQGISITVGDVLEAMSVEDIAFFLPEINLEAQENTLTGYSIFKKNKEIGTIDAKDRAGLLFLESPIVNLYYTIPYKGKNLVFNVHLKKKKIKAEFKNGKIRFTVHVTVGALYEYMDKTTRFSKGELEIIRGMIARSVEGDIKGTIQQSQQIYQCDFLKFYKYFRVVYPMEFSQMNWNTMYSKADFFVDVQARVKGTDLIEIQKES